MAHHNTVFAQMLKFVPTCLSRQGHEFESLANQHDSGRGLRKMTRWTQFLAMATAQLSGRHSLRDVASNMTAQARKRYPLGMSAVSRSSLLRQAQQPCPGSTPLNLTNCMRRCSRSCSPAVKPGRRSTVAEPAEAQVQKQALITGCLND